MCVCLPCLCVCLLLLCFDVLFIFLPSFVFLSSFVLFSSSYSCLCLFSVCLCLSNPRQLEILFITFPSHSVYFFFVSFLYVCSLVSLFVCVWLSAVSFVSVCVFFCLLFLWPLTYSTCFLFFFFFVRISLSAFVFVCVCV